MLLVFYLSLYSADPQEYGLCKLHIYSRQERKLMTESEFNPERVEFRRPQKIFPFPTLQTEVDRILKSRIAAVVTDVSTPQYNTPGFSGGGNLHCATLNIVLPCKPKK